MTATSGLLSAFVTGSGTITKTGIGELVISAANIGYGGSLVVSAGTVTLNNSKALGDDQGKVAVANGSVLQLGAAGVVLQSLTGDGTVQPSVTPTNNTTDRTLGITLASNLIYNGTLKDNGYAKLSLQFSGGDASHSLTLTSSQFYTGVTEISSGSLISLAKGDFYANPASTNDISLLKVAVGGTLDLGGHTQSLKTFQLFGGSVQAGTLNVWQRLHAEVRLCECRAWWDGKFDD
jgi:autotransporter-associated beta strand protein